MTLATDVQNHSSGSDIPDPGLVRHWADIAFARVAKDDVAVTIRIVDEHEGRELNRRYRNQDRATNVLSFAYGEDPHTADSLLGDIVICAPVLRREASLQAKPIEAHWAHMVVHGILHLCGYEHNRSDDAEEMEGLETEILGELGFPPPYN